MQLRATALLIAAACTRQATAPHASAPAAAGAGASGTAPAAGDVSARAQACLEAQLARQGLNAYGDPPDTVYAGGTPLFNTGTRPVYRQRDVRQSRRALRLTYERG